MKQKTLVYWLVLLLVLLNIGTLSFIWLNSHPRPPMDRGGRGSGGLAGFIVQELEFNDQQRHQFDSIVMVHRHQMHDLKDSLEQAKKDLFSLLNAPKLDSPAYEMRLLKVNYFEKNINVSIFNHLNSVKAICNDEQTHRFGDLIGKIFEKMGGFGPNRPINRPNMEIFTPFKEED